MDTCPICLESFGENITTTNCNHMFCDNCFNELLNNNKVECPLCRSIISEYLNNDGKVRILIKENIQTSNTTENEDLNLQLLGINNINRGRNKINSTLCYFYSFLIFYICYSYMQCSLMINNVRDMYQKCMEENENITYKYNSMFGETTSITLFNVETNHMSKMCEIPIYFYNKCFNFN